MRRGYRQFGLDGFTLIELLIVVVIIGILAAIAIPKFAATKEKAYVGNLKSDLRNLATAQEAYYYDKGFYYNGPIPNAGVLPYSTSSGVTIVLSGVTPSGWQATATHAQAAGRKCTIFYGSAAPLPPALAEGEVACN